MSADPVWPAIKGTQIISSQRICNLPSYSLPVNQRSKNVSISSPNILDKTNQKDLPNLLVKESVSNNKSSSSNKIKLRFTRFVNKKGYNRQKPQNLTSVKSFFSRTKTYHRDQPTSESSSSKSLKSSPLSAHRNNKVTPRTSVSSFCNSDLPRKLHLNKNDNMIPKSPTKRKVIFYSERQSDVVNGIPSVPPCTPGKQHSMCIHMSRTFN